ncbi:MAG: SUF system NifU family Fe-S cluster assembly protein [Sphaerochaeta sp.]|jgi:nitrogen fixation NifU-like protein|nr:SUF system NifU family Fe-S cluster assembly protein [Spirochaetales bacterium]
MQIEQLYREVVLSHNKAQKNRRHLANASVSEHGVNPSCGDDITLELEITSDHRIRDISFVGSGCAISQASASILADLVRGKSVLEAKELFDLFFQMIEGDEADPRLLEASVFSAMAHMPARIRCAVLGWRTLEKALAPYWNEERQEPR